MSSPHLDAEQLSSHVDSTGRDPAAASEHLHSCASCQARLKELRTVRAAVGAKVRAPSASQRDQALEVALSAWDDEHVRRKGPLEEPQGWTFPRWAAVAAALLVLLGAVPVVATLRDGNRGSDTALSGPELSGQGGPGWSVVEGGDLGDQSDGEALGRLVRDRLGSTPVAAPAAAPTASPPAGGAARRSEGDGATTAFPPGRPGAETSRQAPPCSSEVGSTYGQGLGELVYTASLRWQGRPAVLLVYRLADPGNQRLSNRAFVMSRDGCLLLVQQGL